MKTDIVNRAVAKWKNPGISKTTSWNKALKKECCNLNLVVINFKRWTHISQVKLYSLAWQFSFFNSYVVHHVIRFSKTLSKMKSWKLINQHKLNVDLKMLNEVGHGAPLKVKFEWFVFLYINSTVLVLVVGRRALAWWLPKLLHVYCMLYILRFCIILGCHSQLLSVTKFCITLSKWKRKRSFELDHIWRLNGWGK